MPVHHKVGGMLQVGEDCAGHLIARSANGLGCNDILVGWKELAEHGAVAEVAQQTELVERAEEISLTEIVVYIGLAARDRRILSLS